MAGNAVVAMHGDIDRPTILVKRSNLRGHERTFLTIWNEIMSTQATT